MERQGEVIIRIFQFELHVFRKEITNATSMRYFVLSILIFLQLSDVLQNRTYGQTEAESILKVGIIESHPFIVKDGMDHYSGLCIDLWTRISKELEVSFSYTLYNDEISLLKALQYGEIDLTINPMNVTAQRLRKFEATQPFLITGIGLATPFIGRNQFGVFIKNFFSYDFIKVILMLVLLILVFGAILWLVERKHNKFQFRQGPRGILDGLWWSAVTMTTVGYGDKAPKTNLGKTVAIIWMFTAVVVISSFTASIASMLTISRFEAGINSRQDLQLVDRLATIGASDAEDFLLKNQIIPDVLYQNPIQGLRGLAKKEIDALIYDQTILNYLINLNQLEGEVSLLPINFQRQYRSFLLPSQSTFHRSINSQLVHEISQPSWQKILDKYQLSNQDEE